VVRETERASPRRRCGARHSGRHRRNPERYPDAQTWALARRGLYPTVDTYARPWHPEPAPGVSLAELARLAPPSPADRRVGVPAPSSTLEDADTVGRVGCRGIVERPGALRRAQWVMVEQLEAARREVEMARSWTFSPSNTRADYSHYEGARGKLTDLTRAAYEQSRIGSCNVRRITGFSREDVAQLLPANRTAARQLPVAVSAGIGY
jgi:hypothetical protein